MFKKYLFILILLVVAIGSLSMVSAEDLNATDSVAVDDVNEVTSQGDVDEVDLSAADSEILANGSGDTTTSDIKFSNPISFKYGETGSTDVIVDGGIINPKNIMVLDHPEALVIYKDNKVSVSGLNAGNYKLSVATDPDENHTSVEKIFDVNVAKAAATIKASKLTVAHKKATNWSIKLLDSKGKAIANTLITLKIYTGNKFKTTSVRTNSKGIANYKTSGLSVGTHKVVLSLSNANYAAKSVSSSIKVIKQTALKFKLVKKASTKTGAILSCLVLKKNTKKGINGIKIKFLVYTGKKVTTFTLKTKKVKALKVYNGAIAFATNKFSVGKHKVKMMPVSLKYKGSFTTTIKIKKSATRYAKYFNTL